MPANKKLLLLPGDGIGPEVMHEVRRVIDWMARRRRATFELARTWSAAPRSTRGRADHRRHGGARQGGGRRAVRLRRRPEMGQARLRQPPGDRHPHLAPRTRAVRQPAPGDRARPAGRRLHAQAGRGARPRPHDRAREHRRHLFRRAARRRDAARRPAARLQHRGLHHARDRACGPRRVRAGAQAAEPRVQRREGQRDGSGLLWRQIVTALRRARVPGRRAVATCMPTTAPCSWCATRASST